MSYITIQNSEDGEAHLSYYKTAEDFLKELNEILEETTEQPEFYSPDEIKGTIYDLAGNMDPSKILVIKGEIIVPKTKKVVKEFSLEEEES